MIETGKFVILVSSLGGRYLGITQSDDRVALLATLDPENNEVKEILESHKSKYIGDYRFVTATTRSIQSFYDKQDPSIVDYLVHGEVL